MLSTDDVAHELLDDPEVRAQLVERLGEEVASGGHVDRGAVARAVFDDPEEREWLEGVLWPRVGGRIAGWREELARAEPSPTAAVVEVPLLFEAGMEEAFDATVVIVAEDRTREARAAERGHAALESRTARQLSQSEKAERADFVIENDGDLTDLQAKLERLLSTIRR